jgi:hypothetical protein
MFSLQPPFTVNLIECMAHWDKQRLSGHCYGISAPLVLPNSTVCVLQILCLLYARINSANDCGAQQIPVPDLALPCAVLTKLCTEHGNLHTKHADTSNISCYALSSS